MPLNAIVNRAFFSDYWLGSIQSSGKKWPGARITPARARTLMTRLEYLRERVDSVEPPDLTTFRERYVRPLLHEMFGFHFMETENDTHLRLMVKSPDGNEPASMEPTKPIAALLMLPDPNDLDDRKSRKTIDQALLEHDLVYGMIITPDIVRLVRKPGEGNKNAHLDFSVALAVEEYEVDALHAACQIFHADNFYASNGSPAPITVLEEESRKQSARVSEDLKEAVFRSAELLIRGFLADIRERKEEFVPAPSLTDLRDAALQALYRILFILYAESRDERLQTHSLYRKSYSLEGLVDQLLKTRSESIPSNRHGYWERIIALFRIYDEGLPPLHGLDNIPPRGGTLFSEKTNTGMFLAKASLPDNLVADLILALATARPRRGVGKERVSFRELAIEQLGSVYEGLLEYEPRIAGGTMIEAHVQGSEFVLVPNELCRLCEQKNLLLKGPAEIVEGTSAERLHPDRDEGNEEAEGEGHEAEEDEEEGEIKKGTAAKLIRRLESGDFYFVPGTARKSSGSYYTREEIVQYLVRNALEELVDGKSPEEIEALRVIDPACGSAHFLVGAARYLGRKLYDAYRKTLKGNPPPDFHPHRELGSAVREEWDKEGESWCKRRIVERCLFGVDLNPMSVQLAQVALWIESLSGDRPLSFFDHHIRCGNSLIGTWLERLNEPPHPSFDKYDPGQKGLFVQNIDVQIAHALDERTLIDAGLPPTIRRDTAAGIRIQGASAGKGRGDGSSCATSL